MNVIRVWGRADSFDLEFTLLPNGIRQAIVPPDTKDGQYAVQIFAMNEAGQTGSWTGILYMSGGICDIRLMKKALFGRFLPSRRMLLAKGAKTSFSAGVLSPKTKLSERSRNTKMIFRGCRCLG
ncbi:MAG: hypothetical protein IJC39_02425 [Firmicutes bacterium]|nr:hypothetical protein [Bacillota bacterium]